MSPLEKIGQLFEKIKSGHHEAREEFFDTIWDHFTTLAHGTEAKQLLARIEDWANANATTYPDFFEYTLLSLGNIEFLDDRFDSASKHLNKALELFSEKKDEDAIAATHVSIGFLYRYTGEIDLALKYGLQGLEQLAKTGKFKMFRIIGCYMIGGIYADTGHFDEALRLFQEGLNVDYPRGIVSMGARLTNGIAGVYMKQKNFSLALENYLKALELSETTTEYTFKARGLTDLGDYYVKMGDYPQAILYNQQALAIRKEMDIKNGSITNYMNLGYIYHKQGKNKEAINVLKQALKLAEEIGVKVKMYQVHQFLSDILLGMGETADSLAHYRAFHEISEDVNHEDLERKVKNQVQLFKAQQTQKENAIIKAQKIEIENKNIELQEIIDELTLAKINKKARAITLSIAIVLFIFQDRVLEIILHFFASDNYWLSILIKVAIIFSLEPVNKAIEHYLLRRVIKRKKKEVLI